MGVLHKNSSFGPMRRVIGVLATLFVLAACAAPEVTSGVHDPHEDRNRQVFETNLAIDRAVFSGAGEGVTLVPRPVLQGVAHVSETFSLPRTLVNDVLQFHFQDVVHNSFRLAVNLTFGLGGLLDPATDMGLEERPSDFGETLHVWGVGEGAYVVLPLLGPSTERDAVGKLVDLFTNPLVHVLPSPERYAGTVASAVETIADRGEYADALEDMILNSADPYAQARVFYLENRRFTLRSGGGGGEDAYIDPYDDSLFVDPYEDPYGQ